MSDGTYEARKDQPKFQTQALVIISHFLYVFPFQVKKMNTAQEFQTGMEKKEEEVASRIHSFTTAAATDIRAACVCVCALPKFLCSESVRLGCMYI